MYATFLHFSPLTELLKIKQHNNHKYSFFVLIQMPIFLFLHFLVQSICPLGHNSVYLYQFFPLDPFPVEPHTLTSGCRVGVVQAVNVNDLKVGRRSGTGSIEHRVRLKIIQDQFT